MGKTLGVIGAGGIGKRVIRIARGFDMKILVYDRHPDKTFAKELGFTYTTFNEALKKSDIVTLHIPYVKENHHIINKRRLAMMKKGAILINTSRGGLIDTEALIKALDRKHLRGVGLDVIEGEKLIVEEKELLYDDLNAESLQQIAEDHNLLSRDNVVFTPHIAFYSQEALDRILKMTVATILGYSKGTIGGQCKIC